MAEANPKPLPNDSSDPPPNKRNQTTSGTVTGGSPPSKHPNENSYSMEDEYEDTASSKPKKEEIKEVEIDIIDVIFEGYEWKPPEIEDTASRKKPKTEVIEEVEIDNIQMMHDILNFRSQIGVNPCDTAYDIQGFCRFFIEMGIGNEEEWSKKMEEMKNKFNSESDPMEDIDKEELKLWKKIWGNEQKPFK